MMFWAFMAAGAFCNVMWWRCLAGVSEHRAYARGLVLVHRAGTLRGEQEYWRDGDYPARGCFDHVQGVDRDVLVQFNRGRREGWLAAADEDLGDELTAVEIGIAPEDLR